jgi:AcrR family transcriptional regulator
VLDAAKEIAVERGMGAVTMGAVAERLSVTRPVIYACFPDRVELIKAVLEREERRLLAGVLAAYPTPGKHRSTQAAFIAGFQALLRTVAQDPNTWRALFYSNPDAEVAELLGRGRRAVADQFANLIRDDLHRWAISDLERKLPVLVELFTSAGEGAVRSLLAGRDNWTPDDLGELVGRAVYRAIRHA